MIAVLVESPYGGGVPTTGHCQQYAAEHGFTGTPDDRVVFAIDPTAMSGTFYNNSSSSTSVVTNRHAEIVHKEIFDKPSIIFWHIEYELDLLFEALEQEAASSGK